MDFRLYWDKIINFFGLGEGVSEEIYEDEKINSGSVGRGKNKIVSIYQKQGYRIVLYHPDSFSEVKEIVDHLKVGKPIILNLEGREKETARRVIDFLSGAVYAVDGNIQKIGEAVFIFTPENIELDGDLIKNNLDKSLWK